MRFITIGACLAALPYPTLPYPTFSVPAYDCTALCSLALHYTWLSADLTFPFLPLAVCVSGADGSAVMWEVLVQFGIVVWSDKIAAARPIGCADLTWSHRTRT